MELALQHKSNFEPSEDKILLTIEDGRARYILKGGEQLAGANHEPLPLPGAKVRSGSVVHTTATLIPTMSLSRHSRISMTA